MSNVLDPLGQKVFTGPREECAHAAFQLARDWDNPSSPFEDWKAWRDHFLKEFQRLSK